MTPLHKNNCLRYIVPFSYSSSFDDACTLVNELTDAEGSLVWEKKYGPKKASTDLYRQVAEEFCFPDPADDSTEPGDAFVNKLGLSWTRRGPKLNKSNTEKNLLAFRYLPEQPALPEPQATPAQAPKPESQTAPEQESEQPQAEAPTALRYADCHITNMGIHLFRNSLGFFWYEVRCHGNLSVDELVSFQNRFKELNQNTNARFFMVTKATAKDAGKPTTEDAGKPTTEDAGKPTTEVPGNASEEIYTPLFMGNRIAEILSFLSPEYIPDRNSVGQSIYKKAKQIAGEAKIRLVDKAEFLAQCTQPLVPDKAILFSYHIFEADHPVIVTEEEKRLAFFLNNGYKPSYRYQPNDRGNMILPFANTVWGASAEGCSYIAWIWPEQDTSSDFYRSTLPAKIRSDYFTLYIKNLFHSYSLYLYSMQIQNIIPADRSRTIDETSLTDLIYRIHLFQTKSMATSVSHIDHQNAFFNHIKQQLRIEEDTKSVLAGLDIVERQQREKRAERRRQYELEKKKQEEKREEEEKRNSERIERGLLFLSLFAAVSALIDGYELLDYIHVNAGMTMPDALYVAATIFVLAIVGYVVVLNIRSGKSKKTDSEDKKETEK